MASGRKAEASIALQDLHLIDFSYSLNDLTSLSTSQLLCASVHPRATDEQIQLAADELQRRREAQTTRDEEAVHEEWTHQKQQLELEDQEWMNKGNFRFGVEVGKPVAGYFYEEPPAVRPRRSILRCSWIEPSSSTFKPPLGRKGSLSEQESSQEVRIPPPKRRKASPPEPNAEPSAIVLEKGSEREAVPNLLIYSDSPPHGSVRSKTGSSSPTKQPLELSPTHDTIHGRGASPFDSHQPPRPSRLPEPRFTRRRPPPFPLQGDRSAIPRRDQLRSLEFNDYAEFLLVDEPIAAEWSVKYLGSIAVFLAACAPPQLWSNAPSNQGSIGIFGSTSFPWKLEKMMGAQPNAEMLRRQSLGRKLGPEPYGKNLKIWASVRDAMIWIWGNGRVSWSEVRWLMEETPLPLFGIFMQLGHTQRYRRGIRLAWAELHLYLQTLPPSRRSSHEARALTLLEFLTTSDHRQKLFFTERDGTTRAEPWRGWFEEGDDSERTLSVLEAMEQDEVALREGSRR